MEKELKRQIAQLREVHCGLSNLLERDQEIVLSGNLYVGVTVDGLLERIEGEFDIELVIPRCFPNALPRVRETARKIDHDYSHKFTDGALCLGIPVELRRILSEELPLHGYEKFSLLGYVNELVIGYLCGYCYWKQHGRHPFGEEAHGDEGIVKYYISKLGLTDELAVLAVVCSLLEYGYRGHHICPCGSGMKVRKCHGSMLLELHSNHTKQTLRDDFLSVYKICHDKFQAGQLCFPKSIEKQVARILGRLKQKL